MDAVGDTLPAAHAYPAVQGPLQVEAVCPGEDPYLPAPHCKQDGAPLELYVPAEQAAHGEPALLYCPAAQLTQAADDVDPAGQDLPAAHDAHVEAPAAALYRPAGHIKHDAEAAILYSPAVQATHAVPEKLYVPAAQSAHAAGDVEPAGHDCPSTQDVQEVAKSVSLYVPSGQVVQGLPPVQLYSPAMQP